VTWSPTTNDSFTRRVSMSKGPLLEVLVRIFYRIR
jgi:hypothetical protein